MDIARINVNGDFDGDDDRNIDDIIRDGEKLKKQGLDAQRLAKDMKDLEGQAFADAMAHNAETIKSNEKVKKSNQDLANQRAQEIAAKERLMALEKEYGKVQDERGKKSSIRSKRDAEFVKQEIAILREIRTLQEQLGILDARKARRLEVLESSFDKYIAKAKEAVKTEEAGTQATERAEKAVKRKAAATEDATKKAESFAEAVEQLRLNLEAEAEATDKLNSARQRLDNDDESRAARGRSRRGGGGALPPTARGGAGGGGGGGDRPPGGLPDEEDFNFDFDKYLQKIQERINQTVVELSTAEGRKLRFYQDELRILSDREKFARRAIDLEGARAQALGQVEELRLRMREEGLDTSAIRRLQKEIDSLAGKINEADEALRNQRGNADGLRDTLRRATFQSQQLVDRTRQDLELKRAQIAETRTLIGQAVELANSRETELLRLKDQVVSRSAQLEIEKEITRIIRERKVLTTLAGRESVASVRELEKIRDFYSSLGDQSEDLRESIRRSDAAYRRQAEEDVNILRSNIRVLEEARNAASDPAAIRRLTAEIGRLDSALYDIERRYNGGRANLEATRDAVMKLRKESLLVLETTRDQNEAYTEQRDLAERSTRGLRDDLRTARLILDNQLARTNSLEAQRRIRQAIADIAAVETRRQRDIDLGDFSSEQFLRLQVAAQAALREGLRSREDAKRVETEYNREIETQQKILREINGLLADRDALFKSGFSSREIDKLEVALENLRRELERAAESGKSVDDIGRKIRQFGADIDRSRAPLSRFELALSRLRDRFGFLASAFQALDANSRGFSLFTTLATAIVEPLAAVVLQLAGGLLAVASSAVAAGAALGGALVAGVAQALPFITLLAAGFKSLIDVVQISNRQRQDEASNLAREARGVGGAADNVNRLRDANESLVDAQRRLSDARQQAIRDLEDLADKERQAQIAAESATLSVTEAQLALRDAIENGTALDVRRAQLALRGAQVGERQAERELGRINIDARTQREQGVEGSDQVVAAKRALTQAERSLADARRSGAGAASALTQATARLNEQIALLSPGQKELLDSINELRKVFRSGPFVEIRDIILEPFIAASDALIKLGEDSGLVGSFRALADSISSTLGGAINSLFGSRARDFLIFINGQAAYNVGILVEGFSALGSILGKVAIAAAPLFREILVGITDTLNRIDGALTEEGLTSFFDDIRGSLFGFGQVIEETFILLKNLFQLSLPAGDNLVSTFATFLRSINQQLADPQRRREIQNWFDEVGKGVAAFGTALKDLTVAIFGGLDPDRLRQFSTVISDILAPAIRSLIEVSGFLFDALSLLERVPLATELASIAISAVLLGKTFTTVGGLVLTFSGALRGLIGVFTAVRVASGAAAGAAGLGALSTVLIGSGGSAQKATGGLTGFSRALGGAVGLRGAVAGLGRAVSALGPYGFAAGIAITLFGDQLLDLIPGLESVEDKAKAARQALVELADVGKEKARNELDLQQALNDQRAADLRLEEARANRQAAIERLRRAETKQERDRAKRELEAARIEVNNAKIGVERAQNAVDDVEQTIKDTEKKAKDSAKAAADAVQGVFSSTKFQAVAPPPGSAGFGRVGFTERDVETRLKALRDILYSDEDFKNLEDYYKGKVQGVLEFIIRQKGQIPEDKLEIIFKAVADNKSFEEIVKLIGINIPKGINVNVLFNQKRLEAEAAKAGKTVQELFLSKMERLNAIVSKYGNALNVSDAERGRPIPTGNMQSFIQGYADGGVVKATPGGRVIRAAEDGYDEYVITTDPSKQSRSRSLINQAARALNINQGTDKEYGVSEGDPPSLRGRGRRGGGAAPAARDPLSAFFTMFKTAGALDARDIPYSWGGGHTTPARPTSGIKSDGKDGRGIVGLDCSSSVSAVLQSAIPGFPTITSGEFASQSLMAPGRGLVTIWSNNKHVFMSFGTEDWGTNSGEPGNGPGFHNHTKAGYTASHPKSLGRASDDSSLFGSVYRTLSGADLSGITAISSEFSSLGRSARAFSPSGGNIFAAAAASALQRGLAPFRQFRTGGMVPGSPDEPYPAILHGGEFVVSQPSARRLNRNGGNSENIIDGFIKRLKADLEKLAPDLSKTIRTNLEKVFGGGNSALTGAFATIFKNLGFRVNIREGEKGFRDDRGAIGQRGFLLGRNIATGKGKVSILEAALDFLDLGGYDPKNDPEAKKIVGTSAAKVRTAIARVTNAFAAFIDNIIGGRIESAAEARAAEGAALPGRQLANSGAFNPETNRFEFRPFTNLFSGLGAQSADVVADIGLERDALINQRASLVGERAALEAAINQAQSTLPALRAKKASLEAVLGGLRQRRSNIAGRKVNKSYTEKKKKADLNEVDKLISAAEAELNGVNEQIQIAENAIAQANKRIEEIPAEIAGIEGQIAETQGREIDALIAQATSGRYSSEKAKEFLDKAEKLARDTNDAGRLAAVGVARFQLGQQQETAEQGLFRAQLRRAELTGDEGLRRTALQGIIDSLTEQQEGVRKEIARLEAEGFDLNSPELIGLKTVLEELGIAIKENTDALNGTTTQNFSSTAWQLFRRAIFGGENQLLEGFSGVGAIDNATRSITTPAASPDMVYAMPVGGPGSSSNSSTSTTNITVNVSEAEPGMDPTYLAGALAFALDGKP